MFILKYIMCFYQISEDFLIMHPNSAEKVTSCWPQMAPKLLKKIRKMRTKDKKLLAMLQAVHEQPDNPLPQGLQMTE